MSVTPMEIAVLWRHVNRRMRELIHRVGKEYDLPPFSFMLLRRIKEEPGVTLSELSGASAPPRVTLRRPWSSWCRTVTSKNAPTPVISGSSAFI